MNNITSASDGVALTPDLRRHLVMLFRGLLNTLAYETDMLYTMYGSEIADEIMTAASEQERVALELYDTPTNTERTI